MPGRPKVAEKFCTRCGVTYPRTDFYEYGVDVFHLDHVVPLAKGGTHTYSNVQVACPPCNIRKGARSALVTV